MNLIEKSYENTHAAILLARLEDLLISLGEPSRLISIYKSSISKRPADPVTKFFLGKLFYRLEMVDDAMETLNSIDTSVLSTPEFYSLRGELHLKRNQVAKALDEFRRACGIKQPPGLPYCCSQCGFTFDDWSGRCPHCSEWNTYTIDLYGTCKVS